MKLPTKYDNLSWQEKQDVRLEYIKLQNNKCWFCSESLDDKSPYEKLNTEVYWQRFPPNFLKYPVHLHHDHKTGLTIGAVHNYCNAVSFDYIEMPRQGPWTPPLIPEPKNLS